MKKKVGEILQEKGWVTDEQINKALGYSKTENCKIGEALVNLEICSQEQVSRALASTFNFLSLISASTSSRKKSSMRFQKKWRWNTRSYQWHARGGRW